MDRIDDSREKEFLFRSFQSQGVRVAGVSEDVLLC